MFENKKPTKANFIDTLSQLDAGTVELKLTQVLAEVSQNVIKHGKKGKVVLTLDLEQILDGSQLKVAAKIAYQKPTMGGKATEEDTSTTSMYVNPNGYVSVALDAQIDIFKQAQETS